MKIPQQQWQDILHKIKNNDPSTNILELRDKEIEDEQAMELAEALKSNSL
jgi:hypothetical protein